MTKQLIKLVSLFTLSIGMMLVHANEVVGSLDGKIIVEQGSLNWILPIDVPEGVNSLKPKLSLNYVGGIDGVVGLGFKVGGISNISRCKASKYYDGYDGGINLSEEDQFCLNGQRLLDTGSSDVNGREYILAVDNGSKVYKVDSSSSVDRSGSWVVKTKQGDTFYFGETEDSKDHFLGWFYDPIVKSFVFNNYVSRTRAFDSTVWYINKKADHFENEINYTYVDNSGYISISEISYDNKKVVFEYESSPTDNAFIKYRGRSASRQLNERLKAIKVYPNSGISFLHSYNLGYEEISGNQYSRLKDIKLCSAEDNCTPPTTFKWTNSPDKQEQYSVDVVTEADIKSYQFADITGDGIKDACYLVDNGSSGASLKWDIKCAVNTKSNDSNEYSFGTSELWADVDFSITANGQKITHDFKLIDINNDQLADFCQPRYDGLHCRLNDSGSFSTTEILLNDSNSKLSYIYRDLNNDGLMDVCKNDVISTSSSTYSCSIANSIQTTGYDDNYEHAGSMGAFVEVTALKNIWKHTVGINNSSIQIVDMNGDGILDYCGADTTGFKCFLGISRSEVSISGFQSFEEETIKLQQDEKNSKSFRYTDLNNDGLIDVCFSELTDITSRLYDFKCSINTGSSLLAPTVWKSIPQDVDISSIQVYDVNDDKYADLCLLDSTRDYSCAVNEGDGFGDFERHLTVNAPYKVTTESENNIGFDSVVRIADVAGDTQLDVCYVSKDGIECAIDKRTPLTQLASITTGYNNETSFEYDYLTNNNIYTPYSGANTYLRDVQGKYKVVSAVTKLNGAGGVSTSKYKYKGLQVDWYKKKRSFNEITISNENSNRKIVKTYFQDVQSVGKESSPFMGKLHLKAIYEATNYHLLKKETHNYQNQQSDRHAKSTMILKSSSNILLYEREIYQGTNSIKSNTTVTYSDYDEFGNPQLISTENGNRKTEEIILYENRTTGDEWLIGLVKEKTEEHSSFEIFNPDVPYSGGVAYPDVSFFTSYEYGANGELDSSQEMLLPSNEVGLKTIFDYDEQGRLRSTTLEGNREIVSNDADIESRVSQIFYDAEGRIDYELNALNQKTQYNYEMGTQSREQCADLPDEVVDVNGLLTKLEYDDFCVKTKQINPDGVTTIWSKEWVSDYDLGYNHSQLALFKTSESTGGQAPISNYFDSLKRVVRVETKGFNGKNIFKDNVYDSRGRLERETNPYFEGEFAGDNTYWKAYEYDDKNRKIKVTDYSENGLRETQYAHNLANVIRKTDANNNVKVTVFNPDGSTKEVKEGNFDSIIAYEYESTGKLAKTDTNGKIVSIEYDEAGRKYKLIDDSIGTTTYLYNTFGELKETYDANGSIIKYDYDVLGQKVSQISTGNRQNVNNTWKYGTSKANKNIGKIEKEKSTVNGTDISEKDYIYDGLGRLKETTTTTDVKDFKLEYTYDQYSRPNSQTYPDGMKVEREYTEYGNLKTIKIPRNNVWDYDYSVLTQSLTKVKTKVTQLNSSRAAIVTKYQGFLNTAIRYRETARTYEQRSEDLADTIEQLDAAAEALEAEAQEYYVKWKVYEALVDDVRNDLCNGCYNTQFTVDDSTSTADVVHYKSNTRTSHYRFFGKWGHYYKYGNGEGLYVKRALLQLIGLDVDSINMATFYTRLSNHYKALYNSTEATKLQQCNAVIGADGKAELASVTAELANLRAGRNSIVPIMMGDITIMIPIPEAQIAARISTLEAREASLQNSLLTCDISEINESPKIASYKREEEKYAGYAKTYFEKAQVETEKLRELETEIADNVNSQTAIQNSLQEYNDSSQTHLTLWTATSRDALNRLSGEMAGNGLQTRRDYDYMTGQLKQIKTTALNTGNVVREFNYEYDALSNVTRRQDVVGGIDENFTYDALDRLDTADRSFVNATANSNQAYNRDYSYDINGNMLNNGEHSVDFEYNSNTNSNRLSRALGKDYDYDNNGNLEQVGNRHYTWTALNKPVTISQGNQSTTFAYDANHKRVKQTLSTDGNSRMTYYVGKSYEHIVDYGEANNVTTQNKHYIYADGEVVAIQVRTFGSNGTQSKPDETRYLHKDNLGNIDTISDGKGEIVQRAIFDPFGKSTVTSTTLADPWTNRGFTGHEELKEFGLVHMNGRIYDPTIGRFISADPYIQDPSNSKSFNRYAYVLNNPLKYVDPSGYEFDVGYNDTMDSGGYGDLGSLDYGGGGDGGGGDFSSSLDPSSYSPSYDDISIGDGFNGDYVSDDPSVGLQLSITKSSPDFEGDGGDGGSFGGVHNVLGFISLIPVLGSAVSLVDSLLYAIEGNYVMAGVSALGVLGVAGVVVGKAIKVARNAKAVKEAIKKSQLKAIKSLEKQIQKHQQKLDDFKANPTVRPGMENLPKDVIKQQQRARINHLETEINTFKNNIDKVNNGGL